jgi:hypothetical protein
MSVGHKKKFALGRVTLTTCSVLSSLLYQKYSVTTVTATVGTWSRYIGGQISLRGGLFVVVVVEFLTPLRLPSGATPEGRGQPI